ncbi:C69 family dipeptidase, partial [Methanobrevibacter sp.]|uniref:C69 family dipeptidase n=1 Tax=Methanobrevibacter sp. TaxID=66852 RepID=UPI00388E1175
MKKRGYEKVSIEDVSQIYRNRYDGTEYSPDETGRGDMRVIGSETTLSAHIVQVFPNLPAEMSCVSWISSGPPVYG